MLGGPARVASVLRCLARRGIGSDNGADGEAVGAPKAGDEERSG